MYSLIDTNLWHFAYIKPKEVEFAKVHLQAREFISSMLKNQDINIAISTYQIAEILEMLRRGGMSKVQRKIISENFGLAKFKIIPLLNNHIVEAFQKSSISNIHIYDYLVVIPVKEIVSKIYSADDHFQHEDFKAIAEVINPLTPWIIREGRGPIIQNEDN